MSNTKELLFAAKKEQQAVIDGLRISLLTAVAELEEIGGKDDYESALVAVLKSRPKGTLPLSSARLVFSDAVKLKEARKKLREAGRLVENEDDKAIRLTLIDTAPESSTGVSA